MFSSCIVQVSAFIFIISCISWKHFVKYSCFSRSRSPSNSLVSFILQEIYTFTVLIFKILNAEEMLESKWLNLFLVSLIHKPWHCNL